MMQIFCRTIRHVSFDGCTKGAPTFEANITDQGWGPAISCCANAFTTPENAKGPARDGYSPSFDEAEGGATLYKTCSDKGFRVCEPDIIGDTKRTLYGDFDGDCCTVCDQTRPDEASETTTDSTSAGSSAVATNDASCRASKTKVQAWPLPVCLLKLASGLPSSDAIELVLTKEEANVALGPLVEEILGSGGVPSYLQRISGLSADDIVSARLDAISPDDIVEYVTPLGSGGCGNTHLCMVRGPDGTTRLMVIKVANDPALQSTLAKEAYLGANLDPHPNVVAPSAYMKVTGDDGQTQVGILASRLVCGMDLWAFLDKAQATAAATTTATITTTNATSTATTTTTITTTTISSEGGAPVFTRPVHPRTLVRVTADVAQGLASVHHNGFAHLDVKPNNVMVACDLVTGEVQGPAAVIDFGLAEDLFEDEAVLVTPGTGTQGFLAPELNPALLPPERATAPARVTRAVDVYSFGVLMAAVAAAFPSDLEPLLEPLIEACTHQAPHKRPTMAAVAAKLEALLAQPWVALA